MPLDADRKPPSGPRLSVLLMIAIPRFPSIVRAKEVQAASSPILGPVRANLSTPTGGPVMPGPGKPGEPGPGVRGGSNLLVLYPRRYFLPYSASEDGCLTDVGTEGPRLGAASDHRSVEESAFAGFSSS